jgi:hypothetical protein
MYLIYMGFNLNYRIKITFIVNIKGALFDNSIKVLYSFTNLIVSLRALKK